MYERNAKKASGRVMWNPDNEDLAAEAIARCDGTTVSSQSEAKSNAPIEVDNECAERIRQKYQQLHVEKYGSDSVYYDSRG